MDNEEMPPPPPMMMMSNVMYDVSPDLADHQMQSNQAMDESLPPPPPDDDLDSIFENLNDLIREFDWS